MEVAAVVRTEHGLPCFGGTATIVKPNTVMLNSPGDETIPLADSQELLRKSGLPESVLIVVGFEHRLADDESLAKMLRAVEKVT